MSTNVQRQLAEFPVDRLKPNPNQLQYFRNIPASVVRDLADDIARNGLREALEILPDGTIISGHQRLRAIQRLGWTNVPVVIRHDLAAAGKKAITLALIEANANRRHLKPLERLELYLVLWSYTGQLSDPNFDVVYELARRCSVDPKTVTRLWPILQGPPAVITAVKEKRLQECQAIQLLRLTKRQQAPFIERLKQGDDLRRQFRDLLPKVPESPKERKSRLTAAMKSLRNALRTAHEAGEEIAAYMHPDEIELFEQASEFIANLVDIRRQQKANLNAVAEELRAVLGGATHLPLLPPPGSLLKPRPGQLYRTAEGKVIRWPCSNEGR